MVIPLDLTAPTRQLLRVLRNQPDRGERPPPGLPESVLWLTYCELRKRGAKGAEHHFLRSTRELLRRRAMGTLQIPCADTSPQEHKLIDDPMIGELWKAYKRCISAQRTGPAGQLLRDIEAQMCN